MTSICCGKAQIDEDLAYYSKDRRYFDLKSTWKHFNLK